MLAPIWTLLVRARTAVLLVAGATLMISVALLIVGSGYSTPAPDAAVIHVAASSPPASVPTPTTVRGTYRPAPVRPARSAPVVIQVVGPSLPVEQFAPPPPAVPTAGPPAPPQSSSSSSDSPALADSAVPTTAVPTTAAPTTAAPTTAAHTTSEPSPSPTGD